jgi:hypothetical protein
MPYQLRNATDCAKQVSFVRCFIHGAILAFCASLLGLSDPPKAIASIPDSNGVYHGCVKTGLKGQQIAYVIDTSVTTKCSAGYTAATWNNKGPTGPAGPTGATGPAGATGAQGPQGLVGPAGPTGSAGPQGAMGSPGPQGPIGLTGATGATGPAGPVGPQGVAGSPGATGPTGPQGPAGPMGVGLGTVVDNLGQVIGTLQSTSSGYSNVIMSVNGQSVVVQLGSAGFALSNIYFLHQGPNCTGPRYFSLGNWFLQGSTNGGYIYGPLDLGSIPPSGEVEGGASYIVYEQTPLSSMTFCGAGSGELSSQCYTESNDGNTDSIESINGGYNPSQPGSCSGVPAGTQIIGSFASPGILPLSSFQVPFGLQ